MKKRDRKRLLAILMCISLIISMTAYAMPVTIATYDNATYTEASTEVVEENKESEEDTIQVLLEDQTQDSTEEQTVEATEEQTEESTEEQTQESTEEATEEQTQESTEEATQEPSTEETTLAPTESTETSSGDNTSTLEETCGECGMADGHADNCSKYQIIETVNKCEECLAEEIDGVITHNAGCSETCTCGTTTSEHDEMCILYTNKTESTPAPEKATGTNATVNGCEECGGVDGEHSKDCSEYVPEVNPIMVQLMAAESVEEMYMMILEIMNNEPEKLLALTTEEITQLNARIGELDPEYDDVDTEDLLDTLAILPNGGEVLFGAPVVLPATATISSNQNWNAGDILSEDTEWTFQNGATVTFKEPITIPSGRTLTLKGWGSIARYSTNINALFIINTGGKLIINGTSEAFPFIIDGKDVIANASLIISSGTLEFTNTVIQNGKNRSVYPQDHENAGKPNGQGGGITLGSAGSLTMDHCVITKNTASLNGGGIYSSGPANISNSEISWNRAMSTEPGGDNKANAGRGGGFAFGGENGDLTLENVLVTENAAMYYGGGGQISGKGSSLTMKGNTVFSYNKAILHGAGALHVTGDATFTMEDGSMENNFAQYCGGAIHSSYSCVLDLKKGTIKNNITNGRGGGVHINTGGAITLNENITISGNKAYKQKTGTSAEVDATGDAWSNVEYEGSDSDFGYGGGVLIDSGTCTVAGATITDNYAEVGGGGIALTMLNMSEGGLDDLMVINFTMTSGYVSNNTTNGNGAGVYIMSNKAKENLIATYGDENSDEYKEAIKKIDDLNKYYTENKSTQILNGIPEARILGGTVTGNTAENNGGGLYLGENTKFCISGTGDISKNKAEDGAGVYVASGTAEINGGTMPGNEARNCGGALYISGTVTMTDGIIGGDNEENANIAINGGAMYVTNGNVVIAHGIINGNKALANGDTQDTNNDTGCGGAVYLAGNTNTMLTMESGTMSNNNAGNDGGAIYASGGTIKIGLVECKSENGNISCKHHTDKGVGRYHPQISGNEAKDTGGGIAISNEGIVHFYCGIATGNKALYKGVGMNVFMDGGKFHLYDGANIGVPRDPDLVIIGGELYNECSTKSYVKLLYYMDNKGSSGDVFEGLAELDESMNLPDGEYFWDAVDGYRFFGWTPMGSDSGTGSKYVRTKEQYKPSGTAVQISDTEKVGGPQGTYDGGDDNTMHLYALWAPEVSTITYADSLTFGTEVFTSDNIAMAGTATTNPNKYKIYEQDYNNITIHAPALGINHPGYEITGWYLFQDEKKNANWGYEPKYIDDTSNAKDEYNKYDILDYSAKGLPSGMVYLEVNDNGNTSLPVEAMTFGDITLVADYELLYSDLTIEKSGAMYNNETFVFDTTLVSLTAETENQINNTKKLQEIDNIKMQYNNLPTVAVNGNTKAIIPNLPLGIYKVEENDNWSWRYDATPSLQDVTITSGGGTATFVNTRSKRYWLDGNSWCQNIFNGSDKYEGERYNEGNSLVNMAFVVPKNEEIRF